MRLATLERPMTLYAMSIFAGFLASGCQKGNSFEQFAKRITDAKSIRTQASVKLGSENQPLTILRQLPYRSKTSTSDLTAVVGENEGFLEISSKEKKYVTAPWGGKFFPSMGKMLSPSLTSCHFAYGISPLQIAPAKSWKLSKNGSNEVWTATVESQLGPQKYEIELTAGGELKRYLNPNGEFMVSKWEINPQLSDSDFSVNIPDGYVMMSLPLEYMSVGAGKKVDFSKMKDNGKNKLGSQWSLLLFSDPADTLSTGMKSWLSGKSLGATFVEVSLGAGGDYSVPDEKAFWDLVSATPTCVLVDKEGTVRALWQGFDPGQTARLEKEIADAMKENG